KDPVVVASYNFAEVKHALDHAVCKVLVMDHGFVENHTATDRRLALGFSASFFAIGGAAYGHFNDFHESKIAVGACIVLYTILSGIMMYLNYFVDKNIVFEGKKFGNSEKKAPMTIRVTAKCSKKDAQYTVSVDVSGNKPVKNSVSKSFGDWIDEDGEIVADALAADVASLLVHKKSQ
ncbi:hypothetical protein HDU82_000541, partial [Entophlyctis luteolus]